MKNTYSADYLAVEEIGENEDNQAEQPQFIDQASPLDAIEELL